MYTASARTQSPLESIVLHLVPGLSITVFVVLLVWGSPVPGIPSMFWLEIGTLAVGTPLMLLIMKRGSAREGAAGIRDVIAYRAGLRWWEYILWPLLMLAFAAGVLTTLGKAVKPPFRTRCSAGCRQPLMSPTTSVIPARMPGPG